MQQELQHPRIQFLSTQLANQIAAGEVIERPASVVKELIENALDAGARRLDIELLAGGMDGIRVTDDGYGIARQELLLAISRHATSKISQLDDLLHLNSLGFRGEALASICSVSQWRLTSCETGQASASQISHDMGEQVTTANHPQGTTVSVQKLFYNTPARRKFLRAERTEFRHCDDVIRRMAMARFDVGFYVKHNGRQVHRLPAVTDDIGQTRRVAQLCGEAFINNALVIDSPGRDMRLWGWVSQPEFSRQQTDLQYFYINGRVIRDRVINHAVRLAYQHLLPAGRHAAYVLHLELDPAVVDVNVHPTKHEVRFRETRLIHDFISRSLREGLQQSAHLPGETNNIGLESDYRRPVATGFQTYYQVTESSTGYQGMGTAGHRVTIAHDRYAILQQQAEILLIDLVKMQARLTCLRWQNDYEGGKLIIQPLLIPEIMTLTATQQLNFSGRDARFKQLGFDITQAGPSEIMLRGIPVLLQAYNVMPLLVMLLEEPIGENAFEGMEATLQLHLNMTKINIDALIPNMEEYTTSVKDCCRPLSADDLASLFEEPAS